MMRLLPVLALAGSLIACAHRPDFGSYGLIEDPSFILRTIEGRYARVAGLAGEGKLGLDSPQGRGTLRMAIEVRKPADIYLETADLFGIQRGIFATEAGRFQFYRPDTNTLYTGPATAEELGRYLPVALPPETLAAVLLGQVPILEGAQAALELEEASGTYLLRLRKGSVLQRVRVGTRDLRLVSIETRGPQPMDVAFSDHEELIAGLPFATTIEIELPKQKTEVKLRYTRIALNPEPRAGSFRIKVPSGARIEES